MKTGQFFSIGNTEGLRLRELSKQFMNATRERIPIFGLEMLAVLAGLTGSVAITIGALILISAPAIPIPRLVAVGLLALGIVGVLAWYLIMRWTGRISETRREIKSGKYRQFIVTNKHYSYSVLLTLEVRIFVRDPNGWPVLRAFFTSPEVIEADETIYAHKGDVVATAESEFLVIDKAEAVMHALGIDPGDRMVLLREAIIKQLQATITDAQEILEAARQLTTRYGT